MSVPGPINKLGYNQVVLCWVRVCTNFSFDTEKQKAVPFHVMQEE